MATSMPCLSPDSEFLEEEQLSNAASIPIIRRLSNVNLMEVPSETYLSSDGNPVMKNSPTATVSLQPIPTTSGGGDGKGNGSADIAKSSTSSSYNAARAIFARGGGRDELFAPVLAPTKNPYQVLSVLKNDPSFVAAGHSQDRVQNSNSSSRFSWILNAFDCCKARKKNANTLINED